jgi:hypothetical protein
MIYMLYILFDHAASSYSCIDICCTKFHGAGLGGRKFSEPRTLPGPKLAHL